jgi:hypothetical protein
VDGHRCDSNLNSFRDWSSVIQNFNKSSVRCSVTIALPVLKERKEKRKRGFGLVSKQSRKATILIKLVRGMDMILTPPIRYPRPPFLADLAEVPEGGAGRPDIFVEEGWNK